MQATTYLEYSAYIIPLNTAEWYTLYKCFNRAIGCFTTSSKLEIRNISYKIMIIDLFRGACAVKGNVQVAGHVKPAPFSRRDVTLGDVDGSLFHITI